MDQTKCLEGLEKENARLKRLVADISLDNAMLKEARLGRLLGPSRRRQVVTRVLDQLTVSERRAEMDLNCFDASSRKGMGG